MPLFRSIGARKDVTRGTTALEVRQGLAGLLASAGGIAARPGVFAGAPAILVTGTAGWNYSVAAAHFAVSRGASDGVHIFGNDGATSIATGAAPGAGTSRIDIVWVRHPSNTENSDTNSVPVFGCAQSLASATPLAPSIPAGALELARNTMLSTATTTASAGNAIVQTFPWTALRGAPLPVRNVIERDWPPALATPANPLVVWRIDSGAFESNAGAGWSASSIGPWISYVAAVTGFAVGTLPAGTPQARTESRREGDLIRVRYEFVFGSNGTAPTQPRFSLLVPGAPIAHPFKVAGIGDLYRVAGNVVQPSWPLLVDANTVQINYGSPASDISPSAPWAWLSGDAMTGEFTYRPAS